jgi:muconate cycloisomerase
MKIVSAKLLPLDIPFVQQFAHSTKTRRASDTVLLKVTMNNGMTGWGETLVRPYLTGETVEDLSAVISNALSELVKIDWHFEFDEASREARLNSFGKEIDNIIANIPRPGTVKAWNGLRCLLELAILDVLLRQNNIGLAALLPPVRKDVIYSGVISAEEPEKSLQIARQFRQLGIKDYKLKITPLTGVQLVRDIRNAIGDASLRLDANACFSLRDAALFCKSVEPLRIEAIEEPLSDPSPDLLANLQCQTTIPIMSDEALITLDDARQLISKKSVKMFNVRLAKCGGLGPCLELAKMAKGAEVALQLGSLVGETAILSAVGRSLAASNDNFAFIEGSYGTLLLKEDIAKQSIRFGHGGRAPLLRSPGLGVTVDEDVVMKYVRKDLVREMSFTV